VSLPDKFFDELLRGGQPTGQVVAPGIFSEYDAATLRAIVRSITVGSRAVFAALQADGSLRYLIVDDKPDRKHAIATLAIIAATLAEADANGE
jgi:hypothetical protein